MKNYIKKFIVGLLVMAMTVTSINYTPVHADDNFYVGFNGNLTEENIMTLEEDVYTYTYGEVSSGQTLSFGIYSAVDWNNVVVAWNDYDAYSAGYAKICYSTETGKVELRIYEDDQYASLIEDTTVPVEYDYYIGFSNLYGMTKEDDNLYSYTIGECAKDSKTGFGIYGTKNWNDDIKVAWSNYDIAESGFVKAFYNSADNSVEIKVYTDDTYTTEVGGEVEVSYFTLVDEEQVALTAGDGKYTYKAGAVSKDSTFTFAVFTLENEEVTEVAKIDAAEVTDDGYALVTFVPASGDDAASITFDIYTDDTYTIKVGDEPVSGFTMYVNYTENSTLYLLAKDAISDMESAGTLWGRTAYELSDASEEVGESGWFKLVIPSVEDLPTFQFVYEISDDNGWVSNFGIDNGTDAYNAIKAVTGNVVYFNAKGTVCVEETLDDYKTATGNVEVKYYIGGKPAYFSGDVVLSGNEWNVLEMTAETDGTYTYKLGELAEGTAVENAIYSDLAWTEAYAWNTVTVAATGYVKLIYNPTEGVLIQKIYSDSNYSTEVSVKDDVAKVHIYYPGTDTLTIAFWTSTIKASENYGKLGTPYTETYWTRTCYPMTKDEENWYSFDVYKSFGGFQIVANPQSEKYPDDTYDKENTVWLINVGDAGEGYQNDGDKERYDDLFSEGEAYIMYNTLFESKEDALAYDKAYSWDYYISGSTSTFEEDCDCGIFTNYWSQDNYGYIEEEGRYKGTENWQDQMTKNGTTLTWISSKKATKFTSYTMNVYADKSWFGKAGKDFAFLAVADAYVKVTYDLKTKVYSVTYFDDAEGKTETEFDEVSIYYYYGSDDATNLTIVLNAVVPGLKVVGTYWGRNAYAMTSIGDGWYQFKGYKALYGGFQIVDNPQGEDYAAGDTADKEGTFWYLDIGDYGDVSTADGDLSKFKDLLNAGNKAYIKYNKIFKTQSAADSFTDWTFYVAGSTTAFGDTDASKGIFSNYWAGNFEDGVDPDTGESYTKKVDTWPDVFTKVDDSTYYVNLPNKAVKGVKYEFNVYTEKDWNATNLTGTMGAKNPRIEATSSNYIRLYFYRDLKTGATSYAVKYFADKDFKEAVKLASPTSLKLKKLKATKGAKIKLSWKAVTGASKYTIYANGVKVGTSKTNSKVLKYKKQGKTIKYTVKASGSGYAASEASKELKVKTPKKVAKKGLKAKNTKKGIQIKWKKVKAANGYVVYRSTKKKKGFKKVATLKKNSKTKFLDKKAKSGKTYYYKVYAYKKNGKVLVYSDASKTVSAKKK